MCRRLKSGLLLWFVCSAMAFPIDERLRIRAEYTHATASLQLHGDETGWIDDDPASAALLERQWTLAADWLSAYLDAHKNATPAQIETAAAELDPKLSTSVIGLSPHTYLIAVDKGGSGTVFVLGRVRRSFGQVWNIRSAVDSEHPFMAAWSVEQTRGGCRERIEGSHWSDCGPVYPSIQLLPATSDGHPRFLVDAGYAQAAGLTIGKQLSIWEWDHVSARLLLAGTYGFMIDQSVGTRLEPGVLRVRTKDDWRTFFSCGSCEGRQVEWTIGIRPDRVEDLGKKSLIPELDLIDELYYRVEHDLPSTDIAAPDVIALVSKQVAGRREEARQVEYFSDDMKRFPSLGMYNTSWVEHGRDKTTACFAADDIDSEIFTIESSPSGPRIVRVDEDETRSCSREENTRSAAQSSPRL